jgi:hypothetical protein
VAAIQEFLFFARKRAAVRDEPGHDVTRGWMS